MPTILFLSNGHGEDTVGARIARQLQHEITGRGLSSVQIRTMPIVGYGAPYHKAGVNVVGPQKELPSGGFAYLDQRNLAKDLKSGFLSLVAAQIKFIRSIRDQVDLVVGVGDQVILLLNRFFLKKPMIFVGVADSYYYNMGAKPVFTVPTRRLMRRYCPVVFARDKKSAESLQEHGVPQATFAGNPMMDTFDITGEDFGLGEEFFKIGVLPGSREEAYDNFGKIMEVASHLIELTSGVSHGQDSGSSRLAFLVAVAPSLKLEELKCRSAGVDKALRVILTDKFGDVLNNSQLVIGLAGTANEQAAGMGKPVVTFPGTGSQVTPRFVEGQKKLLGDALLVVSTEPRAAAGQIAAVIDDAKQRGHMAAVGMERMGGRGAAAAIVEQALLHLAGELQGSSFGA